MSKLDIIRKTKSLFMKWQLHGLIEPFTGVMQNAVYMSKLSKWRKSTPVTGYNDWYQGNWDYNRRINLYEAVAKQEGLSDTAIDYFEFGVCGGLSFKWWLEHNSNANSKFYGFDTFEGLPEAFGPFAKGSMAVALESLNIHDPRATFYKGLFQDTLIPFLEQYKNGPKKLIHMDADIFSATIFSLSQLYRVLNDGDIILFDEFAVPKHEFMAFKIFTESFYVNYEVIGAANNYLFLAVKIKK
ncbi:MAG: class I SAM-dependent methyltransferase [Chitinophagaceae bacterium]